MNNNVGTLMLEKNIGRIFEQNKKSTNFSDKVTTVHVINNTNKMIGYELILAGNEFGFESIKTIIDFIQEVEAKNSQHIPIVIDITKLQPRDKLSINILEVIAYYVLSVFKRKIAIKYYIKPTIVTQEMKNAAFIHLDPNNYSKKEFIADFLNYNRGRRFRKIYNTESDISIIAADISAFAFFVGLNHDASAGLGKLVMELVDNAVIHANSSCIVDLDITREFVRDNDNDNKKFYGVNLTVMNFSGKLFFNGVKEKLIEFENNSEKYKDRQLADTYEKISQAKRNHNNFFNSDYTENHFWSIASLQHHISGRTGEDYFDTNGVGLTSLIKMLQNYSGDDYCYVTSGQTGLHLKRHLMGYNNDRDKFVGLNDEANFLDFAPREDAVGYSHFFVPGTIYNLSFAIETGELSDDKNNNVTI